MIRVTLLPSGTTPDPLRTLYTAYRVDYSALTPEQVAAQIESEKITREQMQAFCDSKLKINHVSPLQQVYFEFGISGVSRAFSHQFVRHHVGIDIEQQSQRYVVFKGGEFPFTVPETVKKAGKETEYGWGMDRAAELYQELIDAGVPGEDARFVIPNAANTNLKLTVNFAELIHMADIRLCTRAQWEFRAVMAQMKARVVRAQPWLGQVMNIKCMANRVGYCDEALADWQKCPISKHRPHKSQVIPGYVA